MENVRRFPVTAHDGRLVASVDYADHPMEGACSASARLLWWIGRSAGDAKDTRLWRLTNIEVRAGLA